MPFGFPDTFEIEPPKKSVWGKPGTLSENWTRPDWQLDEHKKREFGKQLALHSNPFHAACLVYIDANQAMWASVHLLSDPVVIASKVEHKTEQAEKPLDKDGFAAKVLAFAEERDIRGYYVLEGKDRLAAFRLYGEVKQFIGNKADLTINNNNTNQINEMRIVLVKPKEQEQPKTINHEPAEDIRQVLPHVKLVGAA